ncbi:MAG: zinc-dependent metalloprotease [Gammaproteobacteria bacterium]|nr:zinc-dependent metalloprotease [Gammaproteobacteria bacterium]
MRTMQWIVGLLIVVSMAAKADGFGSVTQSMTVSKGFFDLYWDAKNGRSLLAVPQQQGDFILATSLPYGLGSNDIGLDRGLQGGSRLVFFRRVGMRLFLVQKNLDYRVSSDNQMEQQALQQAFAESTLASFDIKAETKQQLLIDVTAFAVSDRMGVEQRITATKQGRYQLNSALSSLDPDVQKSFPQNTEIQAILTFSGTQAGEHLASVIPDEEVFSLRQRISFIALPDSNYSPRRFHPFSGFWARGFRDYSAALTDSIEQKFIPRHRLQKKDPNSAFSEAVEPIVYYVDSGAPEPIKQALIEGASWWNQAFAAAGYIDAFQVKEMPATMDPMDIRYNVILWVHRATRGWSYGAAITDPRTHEILKGHVTLGSLRVRQDLLIAQGLTAPFDGQQDLVKQQKMALDRIRQLAAHEVGHTLGIAHNFAASAQNRASVMDYPHPLIELDGEQMKFSSAYDLGIGAWDKQVVRYGYSDFSNTDEAQALQAIIADSKQQNLAFISDQDARPRSGLHATAHLWDNGTDAATELARILAVRRHALQNFNQNVVPDGTPYSQIAEVLVPIYNLHRYQVEATAKLIAGRNYQYAVKGEDEFIQSEVPAETQRAALQQLIRTLSPEELKLAPALVELIPPKAYGFYATRESFQGKTGPAFDPVSAAQASAAHTLDYLLDSARLTRVAHQTKANQLSLKELLDQLTAAILKQSYEDPAKRLIQMRVAQSYLVRLQRLINSQQTAIEVKAELLAQKTAIQRWLDHLLGRTRISDSNYGQIKALQDILETSETDSAIQEPRLPPGSPIG